MRTCDKGHRFHKISDCPTCPVCEAERAPDEGFPAVLGAPARRALERQGITSPQLLARYSRHPRRVSQCRNFPVRQVSFVNVNQT